MDSFHNLVREIGTIGSIIIFPFTLMALPYFFVLILILYPFVGKNGLENEQGVKNWWPVILFVSISVISIISNIILAFTTNWQMLFIFHIILQV